MASLPRPGKENIPPLLLKSPSSFASPSPLPPGFPRSPLQDITPFLPPSTSNQFSSTSATLVNRSRPYRKRSFSARRSLASSYASHSSSSQCSHCASLQAVIVVSAHESKLESAPSKEVCDLNSVGVVAREGCNDADAKPSSLPASSVTEECASKSIGKKRKQSLLARSMTSSSRAAAQGSVDERKPKRIAVLKFR